MSDYADDQHIEKHRFSSRLMQFATPRPLRGYKRLWLRGDLISGLTVAALVIPLGLAFAELAGLPPVYGLYTSMLPVVVFGLIASTPQAVMGAEAALSGIVAAAIAPAVLDGEDPVRVAGLLTLMIGIVCVVGAILRVGKLAQLVSRTVFIGYLAGVAVSVTVSQIPKIVGGSPFSADTLIGQLADLPTVLDSAVGASVVIGIATLVAVTLGRHYFPRFPTALAMLAVTSAAAWKLGLDDHGVALVGSLPQELPRIIVPTLNLEEMRELVPVALAIALVGFADTTVVSQGFAAKNGYRVNSSRDLAALGAADLASGAMGGLPLSASSARTAVAEASGARSQLAPIVSAFVIAAVVLFGPGLVQWVPQPALGGIIAAVMLGIIDIPAIRRIAHGRRGERIVCASAFVGVGAFGVLEGVLVAVLISIAIFVWRTLQPHDALLGHVPDERGWFASDERADAATAPGLLIYRFDAPLFFANVDIFRTRLWDAIDREAQAGNPVRHVIIASAAIVDIDFTACRVLEEIADGLHFRGITFAFAEMNHEVVRMLRRDGVLSDLGPEVIVHSLTEAEAQYLTRLS